MNWADGAEEYGANAFEFELFCCEYDCKMEAADEEMANPDDEMVVDIDAETGADIVLAIKAVEVDDECIMLALLLLVLL